MNLNMSILISALIAIESGGRDHAVGDGGKALGCLQIREIVIRDVNRIYGTFFEHDHALSRENAKVICNLYLRHYGSPRVLGREPTPADLARIWNGGPRGHLKRATEEYGQRAATLYEAARLAGE